jgi:o-succinylbenzoate synthase
MQARYFSLTLDFKFPAGTSRGILLHKQSWFIELSGDSRNGTGECSTIPGISPDPQKGYPEKLTEVCKQLNDGKPIEQIDLRAYPSIQFGLETALLDYYGDEEHLLFPSAFTQGKAGIPINGLIWMGDSHFMNQQISQKLDEGYRCLKMKVGALNFDTEVQLLKAIRNQFSPEELELRLDANGAFSADEAMYKLETLSQYHIHSIEQPIAPHQQEVMQQLCRLSPIAVALDEELIAHPASKEEELLKTLQPSYIILKPSLLGGFQQTQIWIEAANKVGIGWWVTSALESNIGLNAIAQWTYTLNNPMPQGLGTGQLYHNNIPSPLQIKKSALWYDTSQQWKKPAHN